MTTPASPVTTVPGFTLAGPNITDPQLTTLYTLQSAAPERIEAVYFTIDYGSAQPKFDVFSVQLLDQSGVVLYEQPTPDIDAVDGSTLVAVFTWSRLGNDSAQEPAFVHDDMVNGWSRAWVNMRLPDLVLQPGSSVRLASWTDYGAESTVLLVSDAAVTVTRNAGAVSSTVNVNDILPLLVPTTG